MQLADRLATYNRKRNLTEAVPSVAFSRGFRLCVCVLFTVLLGVVLLFDT